MKNKIKDIIGMSIIGCILVVIIFGLIFFFGGTILSILGLKYDNLWTLAKFFIIYMIIGIPLDFIIECSLKAIKIIIGLSNIQYMIIFCLIDISINTVLIGVLEWSIDGIECSLFTALLFSTIFGVLSYFSNEKVANDDTEL
ncbi:YrvL family regulatory protein [Romboutsia sp. MSSM.1001216sp_RTP31141st1_G3_RTP31141_220114]|uniref:YrvL family regulatory protein n=1 Tax=unclassified Romboutsia TaxID=2626894 RepID=UPI0031B61D17